MNGAQALLRSLVAGGVDTCFANPGTSEMHFVAALDDVPEMRAVLALFEGVATGAADGYARMKGRPAATLLHLGPGLGNGIANLHNARRARSPVVNVVGDHATHHHRYDAPLDSDIDGLARNVSGWVRHAARPEDVGADGAAAIAAALGPPASVATLVVPADVGWLEGGAVAEAPAPAVAPVAAEETIDQVAKVVSGGGRTVLLLGGTALREPGLRAAARVATATGAALFGEVFPARLERGAGIPPIDRLGYFAEFTVAQLGDAQHLVLVDAAEPVSFFAYPGAPSGLVPPGCQVHVLSAPGLDAVDALDRLADRLAPGVAPPVAPTGRPERPSGALTGETLAAALGSLLPEGAIVVDEANTAGLWAAPSTAGAPRHDWLTLTGGAIGQGLPAATGAAVACPDRPVISLEADGSAMYTIQSLWTQAREGLDVTTIVCSNRSYAVLTIELGRVGASGAGPRAERMLDLTGPELDFVQLARGLGVDAARATTAEELTGALERALGEPGPHLVEAVLPGRL